MNKPDLSWLSTTRRCPDCHGNHFAETYRDYAGDHVLCEQVIKCVPCNKEVYSYLYGETNDFTVEFSSTMTTNSIPSAVEWHKEPPAGYSFQTHKFSIIDAISQASARLGTDYTEDKEDLIIGREALAVISTLPHLIRADSPAEAMMTKVGDYGLVGTLEQRCVLWDKSPEMNNKLVVASRSGKVEIQIV